MSHDFFDLEAPIYHQSSIDMFQRCGLQWKFRYVDGIKMKPAAALTVGSSVDAAVTHNLEQKINSHLDLPEREVVDAFETTWNKLKDETDFSASNEGTEKDIGVQLTRLHHKSAAPLINPKHVQWNFNIETGRGYRVGGTADIIGKDGIVEDTKTSKNAYDPDSVQNKFQPAMYSWAAGKEGVGNADGFRYRVLIKPTKTMGVRLQTIESPVLKSAQDWMFNTIDKVHAAIKSGNFIPAQPDSWVCTKKWCGYWDICRGKK